jgi:hypothetical protein
MELGPLEGAFIHALLLGPVYLAALRKVLELFLYLRYGKGSNLLNSDYFHRMVNIL